MLLHTKVTCDWLRLEQSKLGWCRERTTDRAALVQARANRQLDELDLSRLLA